MVSTPTGPPARGRLALALTAAAAAAVPAAAPAAPVAKLGTRSDVAPDARGGRPATPPTRPAPTPTPNARVGSSDGARFRPGPVVVQYAVRPASYIAPAVIAAPSPAPVVELADDVFEADAPVAEVELVKLTRAGGGSRLAVVAYEPGLLRVSWSAGASRGSAKQQLRAGRHEIRLATPRGATHVRIQATLLPSSGGESASTHGSFRLRT